MFLKEKLQRRALDGPARDGPQVLGLVLEVYGFELRNASCLNEFSRRINRKHAPETHQGIEFLFISDFTFRVF